MTKYLETERMIFREITTADEDNCFELDSDPEVMRYLTHGKPSTREEIRGALTRTEALLRKHDGQYGMWAAIEKSSHKFMGWFLFRPGKKTPEDKTRIEVGYRLKKEFWGKGFATEGSQSLLEKGFHEFKLPKIFAIAMIGNRASWHVMEKLGMQHVRDYLDEDFPGTTMVEYEISREQFLARQSQR